MRVIKNSKELKALLNEYKDLILPDEDVRIEYQVAKGELRNVECGDLYLENDKWLAKAETAKINGSELTVLPYGYLSQAVQEACAQARADQDRIARAERDREYKNIFSWLLGEKGDFPNLSQKPHYQFRTELRERLKALTTQESNNE